MRILVSVVCFLAGLNVAGEAQIATTTSLVGTITDASGKKESSSRTVHDHR